MVSLASRGQLRIINESLSDSTVDYFYIGVDNKLTITGVPGELSVSITGANASMVNVGTNRYLVHVTTVTDDCEFSVVKNGKVIASRIYKVRLLPAAIVVLGNCRTRDTVTVEELLADTKLKVELPGCYFKHDLEVLAYQFIVSRARLIEDIYQKPGYGHQLSSWERDHILHCKPGAFIVVDKFILNNGKTSNNSLPPIILTIK